MFLVPNPLPLQSDRNGFSTGGPWIQVADDEARSELDSASGGDEPYECRGLAFSGGQ